MNRAERIAGGMMKTVGWICSLVLLIAAGMAIVFLVNAPKLLDERNVTTQPAK